MYGGAPPRVRGLEHLPAFDSKARASGFAGHIRKAPELHLRAVLSPKI